jgi:hypothetical protein
MAAMLYYPEFGLQSILISNSITHRDIFMEMESLVQERHTNIITQSPFLNKADKSIAKCYFIDELKYCFENFHCVALNVFATLDCSRLLDKQLL